MITTVLYSVSTAPTVCSHLGTAEQILFLQLLGPMYSEKGCCQCLALVSVIPSLPHTSLQPLMHLAPELYSQLRSELKASLQDQRGQVQELQ